MNASILVWAIRNRVSAQALEELRQLFHMGLPFIPATTPHLESEAGVQSLIRLEAGKKGLKLWRNNVGVLEDKRGVPVRYGLANDSSKLNEVLKSGDLIGWRPVLITPQMVGARVAQFVSRECKKPGWNYTATDREKAQLKWIELITADGGDASFVTGEGTL